MKKVIMDTKSEIYSNMQALSIIWIIRWTVNDAHSTSC